MANIGEYYKKDIFYEMSSSLHTQMKGTTTLKHVWQGIRKEILKKAFKSYESIPSIPESAVKYKPLCVFMDDKDGEKTGLCQPSPKKYLGHLKELMQPDAGKQDVISRVMTIEEDHRFPMVPRSHFHMKRIRDKVRKEIFLQLGGLHKYYTSLSLLSKGDLLMQPKYKDKKLYIVDQVFAVDQLWISTFGDLPPVTPNDEIKWEFSGPMPIIYKFKKFSASFF